MTRKRPTDRLTRLVEVATQAFIQAHGYQRTQMDDIAKRLGVSKGTLYLYVESKEALFDLCVRHADTIADMVEPTALPVKTPEKGSTLAFVSENLSTNPEMLKIIALVGQPCSTTPKTDLEYLIRQLYTMLSENRRAIKLVDIAALDHPDFAGEWFTQARGGLLTLLIPYIENRVAEKAFLPIIDVAVSARFLLETCVLWAVHRHWDPSPQLLNEDHIEDTIVEQLLRAYVKVDSP